MWVKEQEKGCRGGVFRVDGRGGNVTEEDGKGFSALPYCPYGGAGRTISRHETGFSARRKSPFGSAGKAITDSRTMQSVV